MPRFYTEGDLMGIGYGSNFPQITGFLSNCNDGKRKPSALISSDFLDEKTPLKKKMKFNRINGENPKSPTWPEKSSCVDEEERHGYSSAQCSPTSVLPSNLEKQMQRQTKHANKVLENARKSEVVGGDNNLHAAMMKCRFADTILRAKQKLGETGVDVGRYKLGVKAELRREVQKQREAARRKLEELEKSVDVQDNFKVLRDFEALIRCPVSRVDEEWFCRNFCEANRRNLQHRRSSVLQESSPR